MEKIVEWPAPPVTDENGLFAAPLYLCSPGKRCLMGGIRFFNHLKRQYPALGSAVWLEQ